MAGFGGAIKLTGEQAYRQALQGIAADLKNVAAEQKLTAATYDKTDTSLTALTKRSEELKTKLASQQEKVKTLTAALKDYQSQQEKNRTTLETYQQTLDKEKKKLAEIEAQYGKNSEEYRTQAKLVAELEKEVQKANAQFEKNETTIKKTQAALTSAEADVKNTTTALDKLAQQAEDAGNGADDLGESLEESGEKANKAANGGYTVFKNVLANLATQVINKAVDGVKKLGNAVFDAGVNFDSAMARVQAVSGASSEDMEKLTAKAKEMGETTKFSATESANALNYMAMAGWKTDEMLNGLEGIMNLAAAAGSDLATTSDIVTDALTAMGYSAGEAGKLADVMAAASSNANTNVTLMGQTFQYAAPIVGALGYNMEDTAVAIGLMANAGIKGEKAGTALRSILTRLSAPPAECAKAMEKLGISIKDSNGQMKPLNDVLQQLRNSFNKLSEAEQAQIAKNLAGKEAMSGLLAIVNSTQADYEKLTRAVNDSAGAASNMASIMQDNVGGRMTLLKSQLEGIYLTIWQKVEPVVSNFISTISKELKKVNWDDFGKAAAKALQKLADGFMWLLEHKDLVVNAIKAIIAAFAVNKIANFTNSVAQLASQFGSLASKAGNVISNLGKASSATTSIGTAASGAATKTGLLTKAVSALASPVGLLTAGATALISALVGSTYAFANMDEQTRLANEHMIQAKKTLSENTEAWDNLSKAQQANLNTGMTEMSYYQGLVEELGKIVDENGKVKDGYEDRANYITNQLKNALGIEIEVTDGVIQKYGEIKQSIQDVIAAKKAKMLLESQEALYNEALEKQADVLNNIKNLEGDVAAAKEDSQRALENYTQALEKGDEMEAQIHWQAYQRYEERKNQIETNLTKQEELYGKYAYNIAQYEDNMAKFSAGKYNEMSDIVWEYANDFESAEDAQKAAMQEKIDFAETKLNELNKLYAKSGDERLKSQIDNTKSELEALKNGMKQYNTTTETELKKTEEAWDHALDKELSELTGANVKFEDAGEGNVQMYIDGLAVGEPKSKEEARKIARESIAEISKQNGEANKAGQYLISGVSSGIANRDQQNAAFRGVYNFGISLLSTLKNAFGEKSPSRKTREMGQFLLKGLGLGIDDEEDKTLEQITDYGESVIDALNSALDEGVSTKALESLRTAIPTEFSANIGTNASRMAEAVETADNGLVEQFKKALGQMKVEMNEREFGKFVDNTVSELVYN